MPTDGITKAGTRRSARLTGAGNQDAITRTISFRKGGGLVDAPDARIVRKKAKYPLRAAYRPRPVGLEPRERRADEHHLPRHEHGRRDREPSLHALRM